MLVRIGRFLAAMRPFASGGGGGPPAGAILTEAGDALLAEDGANLLVE